MITAHCGDDRPHDRHEWTNALRPSATHFCEGIPKQGVNEAAEQAADHLARVCEQLAGRLNTVAGHARARRYSSISLPEVGHYGTEIDIWTAILMERLGKPLIFDP